MPDVTLLREKVRWSGAITATVLLDLIGLGALYAANVQFHVVELAYGTAPEFSTQVLQFLLFAPLAQIGAVASARRSQYPWVIAAWALPFTAAALFAAGWATISMASIATSIR